MIRILVVEDEKPISNLIKLSLTKAGYHCTCVYDGMEAADLLRKMIARTQTVIAVADDTKIGFESFCHVGDLGEVDTLITNPTGSTEQELQKIEAMGICVCRC